MRDRTREDAVEEFHTAFGLPVDQPWNSSMIDLRIRLITEEFIEAIVEFANVGSKLSEEPGYRVSTLYNSYHQIHDGFVKHLKAQSGNPDMDVNTVTVQDKANLTKELADLQYVLSGAVVEMGLPFTPAFNRVHKSNMSKLGDDGKPIRRDDGKVLKSTRYKPANLENLFIDGD